jgi:hypothetical protein
MYMLVAIPVLAVVARNLWLSDRLIERQHVAHPFAWERDGCPYGVFWRPAGSSGLSLSNRTRAGTLPMFWLLVTPNWAGDDEVAQGILREMRLSTVGALIVLVVAVISGAWLAR